jgi:hypothetical protein
MIRPRDPTGPDCDGIASPEQGNGNCPNGGTVETAGHPWRNELART